MIDLHTHILPGMDDGAADTETSLSMLRRQGEQGVTVNVLTSHFYRTRERPESFLRRREEAFSSLRESISSLPEEERSRLPRLLLGAEVAWAPNMNQWEELPRLCISGTSNLLLELPFTPWNSQVIYQLYDMPGRTGILPVLAHIERYFSCQRRELLDEVLSLGLPVQVGTDSLMHPLRRGRVLRLLRDGRATLVASDTHNLTSRPPNLGKAMEIVTAKCGEDMALAVQSAAEQILMPPDQDET